jgi:hypothetical protein
MRAKRVRYLIPTDVEEIGSGRPQATQNLAHGIRSSATNDPARSLRGAACCIVSQKGQPGNRFLLGCRHVLALSLLTQRCEAVDTLIRPHASADVVGHLYEYLDFGASARPCLDAAIALATPAAAISWDAGNVAPSRVEPGVARPLGCTIYTPDGPRPATFVKEWANLRLPYPGCGTVTIAAAYQFIADTIEGDSGSPVMDGEGTLHGMHFWGDPAQRIAFAVPAFMLFRPGLFSVEFELAH